MADDFIRVPADSAGKRVHTHKHNDGVNDIFTQVMHLGDRNVPGFHQSVSNAGAARIEFANGSPEFSAFNRLSVVDENLLGMYKFYQKDHVLEFEKTELIGATVARDATQFGMKLTTNTSNGSIASYFSHRHYIYRPSSGMPLTFAWKIGDTGKANLERYVGWFGNGGNIRVCFEHDSGGLHCVIRDTDLGTDIKVPRAAWSGDRLDGGGGDNNLSGVTYDPTKNSLWWIDFQFLSAGAVRFGTYVNGVKVVCHVQGNYNAFSIPWVSNSSWSFGMEQKNVGVVASGSEMTVFCAVVLNEGYDEPSKNITAFSNDKVVTTTSFVPVVSYRPSQTKDGLDNRSRVVTLAISMLSVSEAVEIRAEVNAELTGDTWSESELSTDIDTAATAIATPGLPVSMIPLGAGEGRTTPLESIFPIQTSGITRHYTITNTNHVTISARLFAAGSSRVAIGITVAEVE